MFCLPVHGYTLFTHVNLENSFPLFEYVSVFLKWTFSFPEQHFAYLALFWFPMGSELFTIGHSIGATDQEKFRPVRKTAVSLGTPPDSFSLPRHSQGIGTYPSPI